MPFFFLDLLVPLSLAGTLAYGSSSGNGSPKRLYCRSFMNFSDLVPNLWRSS